MIRRKYESAEKTPYEGPPLFDPDDVLPEIRAEVRDAEILPKSVKDDMERMDEVQKSNLPHLNFYRPRETHYPTWMRETFSMMGVDAGLQPIRNSSQKATHALMLAIYKIMKPPATNMGLIEYTTKDVEGGKKQAQVKINAVSGINWTRADLIAQSKEEAKQRNIQMKLEKAEKWREKMKYHPWHLAHEKNESIMYGLPMEEWTKLSPNQQLIRKKKVSWNAATYYQHQRHIADGRFGMSDLVLDSLPKESKPSKEDLKKEYKEFLSFLDKEIFQKPFEGDVADTVAEAQASAANVARKAVLSDQRLQVLFCDISKKMRSWSLWQIRNGTNSLYTLKDGRIVPKNETRFLKYAGLDTASVKLSAWTSKGIVSILAVGLISLFVVFGVTLAVHGFCHSTSTASKEQLLPTCV